MDQALFDQINRFAADTPWLHGAITAYASFGVMIFGGLLVAGWWTARRSGDPARIALTLLAAVSTLLAVAVNQPIVRLVAEARPYTTHPHILVLASRSTDFSFPSDHAAMAGAAAAGLWLVSRRLGIVAIIAAVAMAFARVYVAAHYPHDVAAGLLLGATIAVTAGLTARTLVVRLVAGLGRTRLGLLVEPSRPLTPAP